MENSARELGNIILSKTEIYIFVVFIYRNGISRSSFAVSKRNFCIYICNWPIHGLFSDMVITFPGMPCAMLLTVLLINSYIKYEKQYSKFQGISFVLGILTMPADQRNAVTFQHQQAFRNNCTQECLFGLSHWFTPYVKINYCEALDDI